MIDKKLQPTFLPGILILCFVLYTTLSWILLFRDPRAIIGIGNLYPGLKDSLFLTQALLAGYGLNSIPTIVFAIVSVTSIILYIIALRLKFSVKQIFIFAIIFQIITLVSFPILSTDIFSYIFSERVSTVHNENIWHVKPATFPDDQFGVLADWKNTTSVYGGVHYLLYLGPSLLGQNDLLSLVIFYKLVPFLFALGAFYVLYLLLKEQKKNLVNWGLLFVFWNPLFVLEIFGSGHNDSMMIFFTLLSYYFYRRKMWLFAGIILALAVQVKLIPIVLFFFCFLALLRIKNFSGALILSAGFFSINALLFSYMQVNVLEFMQRVLYNGGVYWQSLQNLAMTFNAQLTNVIILGFLLWLVYFIIRQWQSKSDPIYSYIVVLLVYLLFVSAAYWNWYVLWVLPMVPLIEDRKALLTTVLFSWTSLLAYPLLWVIHRINTQSVLWPIITYVCIFLPPIVLFVLLKTKKNLDTGIFRRLQLNDLIADKA